MIDMVTIAISAVIAGADSRVAIECFGHAKAAWLRTFLALPNGIPSPDIFGRVFTALDPVTFAEYFQNWIVGVTLATAGHAVAINGKTSRQSFDTASAKKAIPLVSAWASQQYLLLGHMKTETKFNEITAIPALLRLLELQGCNCATSGSRCSWACIRPLRLPYPGTVAPP